jgi:hypothetical protein
LLIKNKGNVDKVIDLLYEEENKAEQEKNKHAIEDQPVEEPAKSDDTQITHHDESIQPDNPLESGQPEESIEQVADSANAAAVEDKKEDSKPNGMESKELDGSLDDSDKQVDTNNAKTEASKENEEEEDKDVEKQEPSQNKETEKPKKPNARQRKLDKKKAQKELQEKKKQEKAARIAKRVQDKPFDVDSTETSTKKLPSAMKELHI